MLSPDEVLFFPGSLLSADNEIVAPYDLEGADAPLQNFRPALTEARFQNANAAPFRLDWDCVSTVHVVNGMGVTLGDSIVGLTAIAAVKQRFSHVRVCLYRPRLAPAYVEDIYSLAAGVVIDERIGLPHALNRVPHRDPIVDTGNHLFWPAFMRVPMIDFFLDALGVDPTAIESSQKRNSWLQRLPQLDVSTESFGRRYALFCPSASTALRSIPASHQKSLVNLIHHAYGLPVLGFGFVDHSAYHDISAESRTTSAFLQWVKGASFVMTGDSAALHIADGFDVPTIAFFSSIDPYMRARDYPRCHSVTVDAPSLRGLQASSRERDLETLEEAFERVLSNGLDLPRL